MSGGPTGDGPSIPFPTDTPEYKYYQKLSSLVAARSRDQKPRILVFTDIDQDYDDLLAIIFLSEMHRMGAVELVGFVANHKPAIERAKLLRTILRLLGLSSVPVAEGTIGVQDVDSHAHNLYYGLKNTTFREQSWNNNDFPSGAELIESLANQVDTTATGNGEGPLTVLLISTLQDIGEFFDRHKQDGAFLGTKFRKFVSQGGYEVRSDNGRVGLTPVADMANNKFHPQQAANYTRTLASLNLPSDAWSREAAKAARMPGSFIQSLFPLGPIGAHLRWQWMRQEFKFFWDPLHFPFMPQLNVDWYLNTRLGLDRDSDLFKQLHSMASSSTLAFQTVAPHIKVIAYDGCAAVGAVGDDFMRAVGVLAPEADLPSYNRPAVAGHPHRVFGKAPNDLGGVDAGALAAVMRAFLLGGLKATCQSAESIIESESVVHQEVTYKLDLDTFERVLEPWKRASAAEASAKKCEDAAKEAKQDGDEKQCAQLMAEAMKQRELADKAKEDLFAVPGVTAMPSREDIPYEALYKEAMEQLAQTK